MCGEGEGQGGGDRQTQEEVGRGEGKASSSISCLKLANHQAIISQLMWDIGETPVGDFSFVRCCSNISVCQALISREPQPCLRGHSPRDRSGVQTDTEEAPPSGGSWAGAGTS